MHSVTSNAVSEVLKNGMYVGSCVIYNEVVQLTGVQDLKVIGAYGTRLLDFYINVPAGYHLEYSFSAQITTNGDGYCWVSINNINSINKGTWSAGSFREVSCSPRFKVSDITLEPVVNYEHTVGTNLHFHSQMADNYVATFYGVTLTCFLVKD